MLESIIRYHWLSAALILALLLFFAYLLVRIRRSGKCFVVLGLILVGGAVWFLMSGERRLSTDEVVHLDRVVSDFLPVISDALITGSSGGCRAIINANENVVGIKLFPGQLDTYLCLAGVTGEHWIEDFEASRQSPVDHSFTLNGLDVIQRIGCVRSDDGLVIGFYVLTIKAR